MSIEYQSPFYQSPSIILVRDFLKVHIAHFPLKMNMGAEHGRIKMLCDSIHVSAVLDRHFVILSVVVSIFLIFHSLSWCYQWVEIKNYCRCLGDHHFKTRSSDFTLLVPSINWIKDQKMLTITLRITNCQSPNIMNLIPFGRGGNSSGGETLLALHRAQWDSPQVKSDPRPFVPHTHFWIEVWVSQPFRQHPVATSTNKNDKRWIQSKVSHSIPALV